MSSYGKVSTHPPTLLPIDRPPAPHSTHPATYPPTLSFKPPTHPPTHPNRTATEFSTLIGGVGDINPAEWQQHTDTTPLFYTPHGRQVLAWFWAVVDRLSRVRLSTHPPTHLPSRFLIRLSLSLSYVRIVSWLMFLTHPPTHSPTHPLTHSLQEERALLLKFTTGHSRLPVGGWEKLNPAFTLQALEWEPNVRPCHHPPIHPPTHQFTLVLSTPLSANP